MTATVLARSTDPITSKAAAATVKTLTQKERLLLEFAQRSGTAEEAGERAGLLHTGYWKRVSDLVREGLITERTQGNRPSDPSLVYVVYRDGKAAYAMMRPQRSGKNALVWKITERGRVAARALKASRNS